MLNMLKMDLYRMLHTKSLYVIWIILAMLLAFNTYFNTLDIEYPVEEQQTAVDEFSEGLNVGMTMGMLPSETGENITVFDMIYSNMQSRTIALFLVLFAVMFSTADMTSGYIKNIAGQVRNRVHLILSKAVSLTIYSVITIAGSILLQALANRVFFGYLEWGDLKAFAGYVGVQTLLHCAFVLSVMTIAIVLKHNVWSMVIAICLCMNVALVLYNGIDKLIHALGNKDFQLSKYTVTGNISLLSMHPGDSVYMIALVTALVFLVAMPAISGYVFKKRDV